MAPVLQLSSSLSFPLARVAGELALAFRTDAVYVVHTSIDETYAAVQAAARFAEPLGVPVTLLHLKTVPYPQPIDLSAGISPIATEAFRARLSRDGIDVRRHVYACREIGAAIRQVLRSRSLVFIGSRRWPLAAGRRTRRALEAAGHLVIVVDHSTVEENAHA